jgi:hypothetical protein
MAQESASSQSVLDPNNDIIDNEEVRVGRGAAQGSASSFQVSSTLGDNNGYSDNNGRYKALAPW